MSINAILSTGQGQGQVTIGHYIQKSHCGHGHEQTSESCFGFREFTRFASSFHWFARDVTQCRLTSAPIPRNVGEYLVF